MTDLKKYNKEELKKTRLRKVKKFGSFGIVILILFLVGKEINDIIKQEANNFELVLTSNYLSLISDTEKLELSLKMVIH